jgi:hypothetical protein
VIDTALKGWQHFEAQGIMYVLTIALTFVLSLIAAATANERFHKFYALFLLGYLMLFIGVNLRVLS